MDETKLGLATTAFRPSFIALLVVAAVTLAGCNNKAEMKAQITPQISNPGGQATEVTDVHVAKGKVGPGKTTVEGQKIDIDCTVTVTGRIGDGPPVTRTFTVGLHTGPLPKGTEFEINCEDPLIVQVPRDVTAFTASATPVKGGAAVNLPIRPALRLVAISAGKKPRFLIAEPGTQLAVIGWPANLMDGDYHIASKFMLRAVRPVQQKVIVAANVSCGGATYLQPILPIVTSMASVPSLSIPVTSTMATVALPSVSQPSHSDVTLSCGRL